MREYAIIVGYKRENMSNHEYELLSHNEMMFAILLNVGQLQTPSLLLRINLLIRLGTRKTLRSGKST